MIEKSFKFKRFGIKVVRIHNDCGRIVATVHNLLLQMGLEKKSGGFIHGTKECLGARVMFCVYDGKDFSRTF